MNIKIIQTGSRNKAIAVDTQNLLWYANFELECILILCEKLLKENTKLKKEIADNAIKYESWDQK